MTSNLYALLVGIDRYMNPVEAPHLRGCVTDVLGTAHFLREQLGLADENIRILTARMDQSEAAHDRATRENILAAWTQHFGKAQEGDQVFFNYSGHGAQARSVTPNEPSGYDETIVPHDSRTEGVFDILDKELGRLIEQLEQRGVQVTVFLDCCHSGSGTRAAVSGGGELTPLVRRCRPDERIRPAGTLIAGAAEQIGAAGMRAAARSPSGWVPLGNHILLAGCRDEELSHEYKSPETGEWQGCTTYFFHKLMANYRPEMTWADVHDYVQSHVHIVYPAQLPQLEGPANLQIFGGIAPERGRALVVSAVDGEHFVKLNSGVTAGLAAGAKIAIYPPASDLTGEPMASGVVDEVKIDHAWVKLDAPTQVEVLSRAKVSSFAYADQTLLVAVEDESGHDADAADAVRKLIGEDEGGSAFLQLHDLHGVPRPPHYVVRIRDGAYCITDAVGAQVIDAKPSAAPEDMAVSAAQVVDNLEHIAIYNNVATLSNPLPDGLLHGAVTIEGAVTFTKSQRNRMPADPTPLSMSGNVASIGDGEKLFFEVVNNTDADLYLALLMLTPDFGVQKLFPARAGYERVQGGKRIPIPSSVTLDNPNHASGRQIYKVVASSEPIDYSVLSLPELNVESRAEGAAAGTRATGGSALARLMNATRHDGTRGGALLLDDEVDDQWTTAQFEIEILATDREQVLAAGESSAEVASVMLPIAIGKPEGFEGTIRSGSAGHSTRSTGAAINLPPALRHPDIQRYLEPLAVGSSTRSTSASPAVVTIESTGAQLATITPDSPLTFDVTLDDEPDLVGLLPIAFDGRYYYVVGETVDLVDTDLVDTEETGAGTRSAAGSSRSTRRVTLQIERLPAIQQDAEGEDDAAATRGFVRTSRLFFYKMFYRELPTDSGLCQATLTGTGEVVYTPVAAADIAAASRVALFAHGINSDTMWMVEKVWPLVESAGRYDLCLTYDYESFGTGIRENGRRLHEALEAVGFGADDGGTDDGVALDAFGHSMGSQVLRAMVECFGGEAYVDRVFMGGPPNAGSPLVKSRKLLPWMGTLLINQVGTVPAVLVVNWFLRKAVEFGVGLSDLDPDSAFYEDLNERGTDPVKVPYFVQAGNYSVHAQGQEREPNAIFLFRQLGLAGDAGLDLVFGGDHDLIVGIASMESIANRNWPNMVVQELNVSHWGYFHSACGWEVLSGWLSDEE